MTFDGGVSMMEPSKEMLPKNECIPSVPEQGMKIVN